MRIAAMRIAAMGVLASSVVLSVGCGITPGSGGSPSASVGARGTVLGGQQPVNGATITIWAVGTDGYGTSATALASTTTGVDGSFSIPAGTYACSGSLAPTTPTYITARGGDAGSGENDNLELLATLGTCTNSQTAYVNINELTTVASVWALQQFLSTTLGSSATPLISGAVSGFTTATANYNTGLVNALEYTAPSLVNMAAGAVSGSTTAITIESDKIVTLANILSTCVNSSGETGMTETDTACGRLFNATQAGSASPRPYTTLQAALNIARYPYVNVPTLYGYSPAYAPFAGGLGAQPTDWTIGVSYKSTAYGPGAPNGGLNPVTTTMAIDNKGRIWFPSTVPGKVGVAYFDPTSQTFNGAYGGSSLTHPEYIAIDQSNNLWATDFSSNNILSINTSTLATNSYAFSAAGGEVGPIAADASGNLEFVYLQASTYSQRIGKITNGSSVSIADLQVGFGGSNIEGTITNVPGDSRLFAAWASPSFPCAMSYLDGTSSTNVIYANSGAACFAGTIVPVGNPNYTPASAMMTNSATNSLCVYGTNDSTANCSVSKLPLNYPVAVASDGVGDIWVANSNSNAITTQHGPRTTANTGDASYTATSTTPYYHGSDHDGVLSGPYALAIDGSGNVWTLTPAGYASRGVYSYGSMQLFEVVGAAAPTITPISLQLNNNLLGTKPTF